MSETWSIKDNLLHVKAEYGEFTHSSGCVYYDMDVPCPNRDCFVCACKHLVKPTSGRIFVQGTLYKVDCERLVKVPLHVYGFWNEPQEFGGPEGGKNDLGFHQELGLDLSADEAWLDRFMPQVNDKEA